MNLTFLRLCVYSCVLTGGAICHADLAHKYTFNDGNANDSVGTKHGTVIDNTGISGFSGGRFDLTNNNGANSNQDFSDPAAIGAYVDLPNGIFTDAVNDGDFGQVSFEIWLSVQDNRTWAEAVTFGTSNGGEDTSGDAGSSEYIALIPQSGDNDFRATTRSTAETPIIGGGPLPTAQKHHIVVTMDQLDDGGGVNANGTALLYLNDNGTPVSAGIEPLIDFMNDNNNWLGRSQWGDPLFDGFIDEFRIYDHALTPAEVTASNIAGPEPSPLPVLTVNRTTGEISIENPTGGSMGIKGYSITSAEGSIDTLNWDSIDSGSFDPNGTWTVGDFTASSLEETNTGGVLDGGTIPGNSSQSIGMAWQKTPIQDLVFGYTLADDSTGSGQVQYIGDAIARSDLNGDGNVDAADWAIFVPNGASSFPFDTAVSAFKKGDIDGDKDSDYDDFKLFKADFIAANGVAAFQALTQSVPEPTSLAMFGFAALAMTMRRTRR